MCGIAKYHTLKFLGRVILRTSQKLLVFGFFKKWKWKKNVSFVYLSFFLETFDFHYMCFNKGNVGWVVECRDWFKDMMISFKG
jgi:hypothetical protein